MSVIGFDGAGWEGTSGTLLGSVEGDDAGFEAPSLDAETGSGFFGGAGCGVSFGSRIDPPTGVRCTVPPGVIISSPSLSAVSFVLSPEG